MSTANWKVSEFANGDYSLGSQSIYSLDPIGNCFMLSKILARQPGKQILFLVGRVDLEKPSIIRSFFRDNSSIYLDFSKN